jgi:glycine cleavage system transcriptional repressor
MTKFIISVIGKDRPGILAAVTRVLFETDVNIEDVSQTILQSEFCGIFIVTGPDKLNQKDLLGALQNGTLHLDLQFHLKELEGKTSDWATCACEPFVLTTRGPDDKGLVAGMTAVLAEHNVNVTQLKAIFRGGDTPERNIMIYEVDIPLELDLDRLRNALQAKADELSLKISIQHRNIFHAINRI